MESIQIGKYALVAPAGGYRFWVINDMEKLFAVVCISLDFPNAARVATDLFETLTGTVITPDLKLGSASKGGK